jgi:polyhydroxybutyrate depolymerase
LGKPNARIAAPVCIIILAVIQMACGQTTPPSESSSDLPIFQTGEPAVIENYPMPASSTASTIIPVEAVEISLQPTSAEPSLAVNSGSALEQTAVETAISTKTAIIPGDSIHLLEFGGKERSYLLHIPPGIDLEKLAALVLVYHGIGLDAEEMVRITGLSELADNVGFIAVYPNGTGTWRSWNGGVCCGEAAQQNVDDVAFTRQIIQDLEGNLNIDPHRIYATGFSNGAIMAYRLACDMSDQIAAVAPVSAAPAVRSCQPARPVPVIHFHGDEDDMNPYEGGITSSGLNFLSVESGIAAWVQLNGCPAEAAESVSGDVIHRVYAPCKEGAAVELYKILGGKHAWPGGEPVSLVPRFTVPTAHIQASELIWEFFSTHPMP